MNALKSLPALFVWLFLTSFLFWGDDEEKQLQKLHQSAESALQARDFAKAKESYTELLSRVDVYSNEKYKVNWTTYIDTTMRLAETLKALGEIEKASNLLSELIAKSPPGEYLAPIQLSQARLISHHNSPQKAFREMVEISYRYPKEKWKKEEQSFFVALEYSLDTYYDQLAQKAKRHLSAKVHEQAIELYKELVEACDYGYYPKASLAGSLIPKKMRYRLAEAYFQQSNFEGSLTLLPLPPKAEDEIDREMIYLTALCYREKEEYEKALDLFHQYTKSADRANLDHYDHAVFEIGYFYYRAGNLARAKETFELLKRTDGPKKKPAFVAALYLARILIKEGAYREAEVLLNPLAQELPIQDPLRHEFCYLRGEAAYYLGEYSIAKDLFERSLPLQKGRCAWAHEALYHLGLCYLRLGDDRLKGRHVRLHLFQKAEELFEKLLGTQQKESAFLALARLHLTRHQHFRAQEDLQKLTSLLSAPTFALSNAGQQEILLLQGECAADYSEKERFYALATESQFRHCPLYADAWYVRALNHFQEGLRHPQKEAPYFEMAVTGFEQAFNLIGQTDKKKASQILKLEAKANFYRNSPISSLSLLEILLNQFEEKSEQHEEALYLRGLVAAHLPELNYFPIAIESLSQVVAEYPQGQYVDHALHILGTLYFKQKNYTKAKATFLKLAKHYPDSSLAAEGWFWAAESSEKQALDDVVDLRKEVYENYPQSEKAAEAYFRQYPYAKYLEGESRTLAHLKDFPRRFPNSPLLVVIHYLLGLNNQVFEEAKESFEEAVSSFQFCLEEGKIPETAFVYFRYQALLKLAQLHLTQDLELTQKLLQAIASDFMQADHPLASLLCAKSSYPPIYEECEYTLAQCYLKLGKELRAQKQLASMLAHYEQAGIKEGYYLSQVWKKQGTLALRCEDYETALKCYEIAEKCGQLHLPDEKKLSLWVLQSQCYRGKKDYDAAMRLLSKTINADIASPLRLKAMYLRAEIYEEQTRPELAIRQLEATAKKGGEWGLKSKEKLRANYGME